MTKFLAFILFFIFGQSALAASVSGRVYGGPTPLANASITFTANGASEPLATVVTDGNGNYTVELNDDTYYIGVAAPEGSGFGSSVVNNVLVSGSNVTQNIVLVAGSSKLSGTVYDGNGQPLANVRLTIYDQASGVEVTSANSTANGTYSIGLGSGIYKIYIQDYDASILQAPMRYTFYDIAKNINMSSDVSLNLVLPFATISGKTTDANGVPIPGVKISADKSWYALINGYNAIRGITSSTTSDVNGNYNFIVVKGLTAVKLEPPTTSNAAITFLNINEISESRTEDLILDSKKTLSGTVFDGNGQPLANVRLTIYDQASGVEVTSANSTANGTYSIGLGSGIYKIYIQDYDASILQAPMRYTFYDIAKNINMSSDVSLNLVLPFATISGKTTDANGVPIPGVKISADKSWYALINGYNAIRGITSSTTSDVNGNYNFIVVKGLTAVKLEPPTTSNAAITFLSINEISESRTEDLILDSKKTLSGTVFDGNGQPLANVRLTIYDQASGVEVTSANSTANGTYSIGLGSGIYKIYIQDYDASILQAPMRYTFYDIAKNINMSSDVSLNLVLPFATISGKTTDANGVPIPGVKISADKSWYALINGYNAIRGITSSTTSDINGNYNFIVVKGLDSQTITPPANSGFSLTTINGLNVQSNFLQNIILPLPDITSPVISGKPSISFITDSSALISWETNEPARSIVYYGEGSKFDQSVISSNFTRVHSVLLTNLTSDLNYSLKVSVSDKNGNGPTFSTALDFKTKITPDTTPPVIIEGPVLSFISHDSAIIEWKTNEPSSTELIGYSADPALKTNHSVKISKLIPSQAYTVQARAIDGAGNGPTLSRTVSFHTLDTPDTTPPNIIAGPMLINVTQNEATIVWETDEPSLSGVSYDDKTTRALIRDENLEKRHEIRLTNLKAATTYFYTVSSSDSLGNGPSLSVEKTFTTLSLADKEGPVLTEEIKIIGVTHKSAVLQWRTDEPSNSVVRYGTDPKNLNQEVTDATMKDNHNQQITGLLENTIYYLQIDSSDSSNNMSSSAVVTFKTLDRADTAGPIFVVKPTTAMATNNKVILQWETDKPAGYQVFFGTSENLNFQASVDRKRKNHTVTISNLKSGQVYDFKIIATDASGNQTIYDGK